MMMNAVARLFMILQENVKSTSIASLRWKLSVNCQAMQATWCNQVYPMKN